MAKTYVTANGIELKLLDIPPMLVDVMQKQQAANRPAPPTYEVRTATGSVEVHEHDVSTLTSDEDRAMWAAYIKARDEADKEAGERMTDLILLKGIEIEVPDGEWLDVQRFLGIDVPENPTERKLHYLKTEVLTTVDDFKSVMGEIMGNAVGGVRPDMLADVDAVFRGDIPQEVIAKPVGTQGAQGGMEPQLALSGSDDGQRMGFDADAVLVIARNGAGDHDAVSGYA